MLQQSEMRKLKTKQDIQRTTSSQQFDKARQLAQQVGGTIHDDDHDGQVDPSNTVLPHGSSGISGRWDPSIAKYKVSLQSLYLLPYHLVLTIHG